jgi:hypothetical protein
MCAQWLPCLPFVRAAQVRPHQGSAGADQVPVTEPAYSTSLVASTSNLYSGRRSMSLRDVKKICVIEK